MSDAAFMAKAEFAAELIFLAVCVVGTVVWASETRRRAIWMSVAMTVCVAVIVARYLTR